MSTIRPFCCATRKKREKKTPAVVQEKLNANILLKVRRNFSKCIILLHSEPYRLLIQRYYHMYKGSIWCISTDELIECVAI